MGKLIAHVAPPNETEVLFALRLLGATSIKIRDAEVNTGYRVFEVEGPEVPNRQEPTEIVRHNRHRKNVRNELTVRITYEWAPGK